MCVCDTINIYALLTQHTLRLLFAASCVMLESRISLVCVCVTGIKMRDKYILSFCSGQDHSILFHIDTQCEMFIRN
jgi:hypothetical protein